ncbi:GGDEF domain-containing protein [Weissella koreensis]|uniref:GGDEF domain-containing protein n=1 Tax=Weissella koreensis TaxID=165096 RepID=UPI0022BA4D5B|nr:GGDEF domain-containing protein [Weissella koreensis]MCZ9311508.1 GGDEF domain-containing protein [Weissella koreensis]
MKDNKSTSILSDVYLLIFLALILTTAIMTELSGQLMANAIYLFVTMLLILIMYFFGLFIGLAFNLVFMFGQVLYMIFLNSINHGEIELLQIYWLIVPLVLSFTFYSMTNRVRQLQSDNLELQNRIIEQGAFNTKTNLRTTAAFLEDSNVFTETSQRFNIPTSVVAIQVRYLEQLREIMSERRIDELIDLTTTALKHSTRGNDISYLLNDDESNLTWATLLYTDLDGAKIVEERIKDNFDQLLINAKSLKDIDISLKTGAVEYDNQEMKSANAYMDAAIKELEYDV